VDVVLSTAGAAPILLHLAGCPQCRHVVEVVVRGSKRKGHPELAGKRFDPLRRSSCAILPFSTTSHHEAPPVRTIHPSGQPATCGGAGRATDDD